ASRFPALYDRRYGPHPTARPRAAASAPRTRRRNRRGRAGAPGDAGDGRADRPMTSDGHATSTDASDDIRLLGRLIGDVLRAHAGEAAFELVERTRQAAVQLRRNGDDPIP